MVERSTPRVRWDSSVNYCIENEMLEGLAFRCEWKKKRKERHTDGNKSKALWQRDRLRRKLEERAVK
jgi:hypothetical protein